MEQPSYSPNLSPCDYQIFDPLKEKLGRKDTAVKTFVRRWLKTGSPFLEMFNKYLKIYSGLYLIYPRTYNTYICKVTL